VDRRLAGTWDLHDPSGYPQPVHHAVAEWAVRTPDAPAISCADGTLRYRELDERANRLARHLRSLGVSRNSVVAIHLERGLDHYVALLAVLKAGGAALPLESTHPTARLRFLLDDSAARVLLTRAALNTARGGAGRSTVVRVDADVARIAAHPPTAPPDEVGPVDPAYVLYVPASTGPPKGVLLQHGGIANLCRWHVAALGLTPADCGSLAAPLGFATSIVDLWPLLVAGGRTVAIDDDIRTDPARLVRTVREKRVTVCFLTTALAEIFLAQPGLEDLPLRYLVTGGETLRRRPRPGLPFRLINTYGSTETMVYATSAVVEDTEQGSGAIPIGHPIGGVGVHLLDRTGRPVLRGPAAVPARPARVRPAGPPHVTADRRGRAGRRLPGPAARCPADRPVPPAGLVGGWHHCPRHGLPPSA
jgi:non-ribosomal peptide synthetase component F